MEQDISAYIDNQLSPEARIAFELQMAKNPALRDKVAAFARQQQVLRDCSDRLLSMNIPERHYQAIGLQRTPPRTARAGYRPQQWAAAVILCVVSATGGWLVAVSTLPEQGMSTETIAAHESSVAEPQSAYNSIQTVTHQEAVMPPVPVPVAPVYPAVDPLMPQPVEEDVLQSSTM